MSRKRIAAEAASVSVARSQSLPLRVLPLLCLPALSLLPGHSLAQLAEEHGNELAPASEAPGVAFGSRLLDRLLKVETREELENLAEHAHEPTHC